MTFCILRICWITQPWKIR